MENPNISVNWINISVHRIFFGTPAGLVSIALLYGMLGKNVAEITHKVMRHSYDF
jgi:hypothetical protein